MRYRGAEHTGYEQLNLFYLLVKYIFIADLVVYTARKSLRGYTDEHGVEMVLSHFLRRIHVPAAADIDTLGIVFVRIWFAF